MKNIIFFLGVFMIAGCSKSSQPGQPAEQYLKSGTWRVTQLVLNGVDNTALFDGYTFTFNSGTVRAIKGSASENGNWSVGYVGSGVSAYNQLIINFPGTGICSNLNQQWDLYGTMPNQISAHKNFSGSGEIFVLWLEKN